MSEYLIGKRIKALRKEKGLTQDNLTELLGFNDRQTVSAIETGTRRVTAGELILVAKKFGESLDYFTDPFRLVGEGRFSWRQTGAKAGQLNVYEQLAGSWIAAYRTLSAQTGQEQPLLRHALSLDRHARYEDAIQAGERFADQFSLGKAPALRLAEVMENDLGISVLMVDAPDNISGAACRLPDLDVVLISRHEVAARRHFNLAYELFHLLTWEAMPPKHMEEVENKTGNRVEQLANTFAAAVLMPSEILEQFGEWSDFDKKELIAHLNHVADKLHVASSALKWHLVTLGKLKKAIADSLPQTELWNNGRRSAAEQDIPPLFSPFFMKVIGNAIEDGKVSVRRLTRLFNMSVDDLSNLFTAQGLKSPILP